MQNYDTLYNNPLQRRRVTYNHVWWDNAFTNEQLNDIESICGREELVDGPIVGEENDVVTKNIRKSKIKFFIKNEENRFIFETFNYVAQSLNNQYYGFNLNGYETFQYTVYDGKEQGNYSWHMDMIMDNQVFNGMEKEDTRKLTLVLLLSEPDVDFKGGELQINPGKESNAITVKLPKGRIVAFPSWMIHQVAPVTSGIRKSIVVWVEGPKFI